MEKALENYSEELIVAPNNIKAVAISSKMQLLVKLKIKLIIFSLKMFL